MENSLKVLFVGCGDIGLRTIRQLQKSNVSPAWEIQAMRRHPEGLPSDIDTVVGDLRDVDRLVALLDSVHIDALVITLTPEKMSDDGYRDTYVVAAQAVVSAMAKTIHPPQLVVWVSSSGVYGQSDGEWVDELSETRPVAFRGKRLLEAEKIMGCLSSESLSGDPLLVASVMPRSVVVRFSGIYGPGRSQLINQVKRGDITSESPEHWTNRIHSEDCAGVITHLLSRFCRGESLEALYLATDNEPVPAYEIQRWLAARLGVSVGASYGGQEAQQALRPGNRRCSNHRLRESGYQFLYPTYRAGYQVLLGENEQ
jgi:nucleoside-diphosphate-sugar epimerase